jgi:lipopolysaccharide export system permease protein
MVRLIDRLIIKEIFGPWVFGVGMFTSLLLAGTYLGRIAGFVVDGVPGHLIFQLFVLWLPAFMVKTFSMAVLLAALLSFGRLSSDSEIVALRAGGASIPRIVAPVALFAVFIAIGTFLFNETVVPSATARSAQLLTQIATSKQVRAAQPQAKTIVEDNRLRLAIIAKNINILDQTLQGVTLVVFDDEGRESLIMLAKELQYTDKDDWRIRGGATVISPTGRFVSPIDGDIWPEKIVKPNTSFGDLIKERDDDFDAQSMRQLLANIKRHRELRDKTTEQLANYEYGYWNKLSVPLAAIVFGTLGAVLGIRNHRTGTAAGFALAVGIIFGYVTLANFMNVWAQGGVLPAWAASFAPIVIGLVCSGVIMWRRNA